MIGISWGGFNGLQVAARQPPALKAVISIASTVDRYADDVHFMGGALLADNMDWGGGLLHLCRPAARSRDGGRGLAEAMARAAGGAASLSAALARASAPRRILEAWLGLRGLCRDQMPGAGGQRLGRRLYRRRLPPGRESAGPCKGLVGPWGHLYPHRGVPGPAIGFLQECVRWWDRWLKDKPTGVEHDPTLRLWLQDSVPPQSHYDYRPGRWIGIDSWPAPEIEKRVFALNPGQSRGEGG